VKIVQIHKKVRLNSVLNVFDNFASFNLKGDLKKKNKNLGYKSFNYFVSSNLIKCNITELKDLCCMFLY